MKCLIKYLEEWWRKFMLYWIKWIWEMEGNYVGKESNEGSSQMRQWIDEIGIGPLVLNATIHLSIQSNSWGFAPQSKNDSLSFQNRFGMMKIYVRFVEYLQTQLVQHDWSHMTELNVLCQGKDLSLKRAILEVTLLVSHYELPCLVVVNQNLVVLLPWNNKSHPVNSLFILHRGPTFVFSIFGFVETLMLKIFRIFRGFFL